MSDYDAYKYLANHKENLEKDKIRLKNHMSLQAEKHRKKIRWLLYKTMFKYFILLTVFTVVIYYLSKGFL